MWPRRSPNSEYLLQVQENTNKQFPSGINKAYILKNTDIMFAGHSYVRLNVWGITPIINKNAFTQCDGALKK